MGLTQTICVEFVWGLPFVKKVTWTKGLDAETGKPLVYNPNAGVRKYNGVFIKQTCRKTPRPPKDFVGASSIAVTVAP